MSINITQKAPPLFSVPSLVVSISLSIKIKLVDILGSEFSAHFFISAELLIISFY